MAVDPRWTANQEVSRAASGSANELVPALARIIESGAWREFVHPMHGLTRYRRFADYCRDFLGLSAEAVEGLLDRSFAKADAITVRRLIREGIEPANEPDQNRVSNTHPQSRKDAASIVARLKRDRPDLAQQVIDGDLSPHAAALKAGIRRPRASFRTDDVNAAVAVLLRYFTPEQIRQQLGR